MPADRNWDFKGLEKFTNYSCWLRAFNNFGNGTWSKELVVSTDEDGKFIEGGRSISRLIDLRRILVQTGQQTYLIQENENINRRERTD